MKYYGIDPSLVQIYNIRNLESVKVWDLVQNEIGKRVIVPAIMIIYDGGKQLNLCAKDKYFDIYVKKVVEVYKDEKDNILEDNLTDPFRLKSRIDIDDNTKKIFESGNLEKINEIFHFYQGKEAYDESLMFQIDEVRPLIKLVQYHIRRLFDNTDRNISFNDEFSGYRDNYLMSGQINGIESYFPFSYQNNDDSYEFWVNGLVNQNKTVKVSVSFKKDEISVEVKIDGFELDQEFKTDVYEYKVITDKVLTLEELELIKPKILAKANSENVVLEVVPEITEDGKSIITIIVKDAEKEYARYIITFGPEEKEDENIVAGIVTDNSNNDGKGSWLSNIPTEYKLYTALAGIGLIFLIGISYTVIAYLKSKQLQEYEEDFSFEDNNELANAQNYYNIDKTEKAEEKERIKELETNDVSVADTAKDILSKAEKLGGYRSLRSHRKSSGGRHF